MTGSVVTDSEYHRFWGARLLVVAVLSLAAILLTRGLHGGPDVGTAFVGALVYPVMLLVLMGAVLFMALGGSLRRYFLGLGRGAGRAARSVGRAAARGAAAGAGGGARGSVSAVRASSPTEMSMTVRRFRVQTMSGEVHACMLAGDLQGDDIRQGDVVRVRGHRDRHSVLVAKTVEIMTSPSGPVSRTVTARPPSGFVAARIADRVGRVLGALILVWVVLRLTGVGS